MSGTFPVAKQMNLMHTLPQAMQRDGIDITTSQLGRDINYSQSTVSRFATGKQSVPYEALQKLLEAVPDPFLALDISHKLIGVTVPVINGPKIVKEPLAMDIRSVMEAKEAIESIVNCEDELTIPSEKWTSKQRDDPTKSIDECLDAVLYLQNYIVFACQELGIDVQTTMAKRTKLWQARGITR